MCQHHRRCTEHHSFAEETDKGRTDCQFHIIGDNKISSWSISNNYLVNVTVTSWAPILFQRFEEDVEVLEPVRLRYIDPGV